MPQHDSRRRVMLYIGKGFDATDAIVDETQIFLTEAWRLGVAVIALDAGVLPRVQAMVPRSSDVEELRDVKARRSRLEQLALLTHGFLIADAESLRDAAVRISEAIR